jgi:hypothetical protein
LAFAFLKPDNLKESYTDSKTYTESLTDKFWEYERIARNLPIEGIDPAYPDTTDGTTASIIRKTPHRIIQQLPTGVVKSDTEDWLTIIASFIYSHKIIPHANEHYALLQKCWNMVERALTFGFCPIYTPFVNHNGYFCSDMRLPYWGDVFIQPGKLSDSDSNFIFLRTWWTKADIDALRDRENQLSKSAKSRKEAYDSGWDTAALGRIKNEQTSKPDKASTPSEREKTNAKGKAVELITAFQRGKKAKFYTFHPRTEEVVRTKENRDPRGEMPINFMYADIDGSNPFGRGIVELVGPMQNLMDAEIQMYQYNRAYNLNPALLKKGNFSKNKIKLVPNIVIDLGTDPNADVKPLTIDSAALQNFGNNYGLMKSQLLNLLASPDTSISAEVGNPGFSKTPAGVQAMQSNLSVDDNYVRKLFETAFENWSETAINVYFGERTGIEDLQLDKSTAEKLRKLANEGKFDESLLTDDNKVRIDFSKATEALRFEVDASTSKMQDDQKQLQGIELLLNTLEKSQILMGLVPPEKIAAAWNSAVAASGVENPEELDIDIDAMKQQAQQMQQAQQPQEVAKPPKTPAESINYKDAPEDIKRQIEAQAGLQPSQMASPVQQQIDQKNAQQASQDALATHKQAHDTTLAVDQHVNQQMQDQMQAQPQDNQYSPEDQQLIDGMRNAGIEDTQIGRALAMLHNGYGHDEIMSMLGGQGG